MKIENIEVEIDIRAESLIEEINKYRDDLMFHLKKHKKNFEK
jgi:hypothetical protein